MFFPLTCIVGRERRFSLPPLQSLSRLSLPLFYVPKTPKQPMSLLWPTTMMKRVEGKSLAGGCTVWA